MRQAPESAKLGRPNQRFCPDGHDKLAPYGMHLEFTSEGHVLWRCAICRRLSAQRQYKAKKAKGLVKLFQGPWILKSNQQEIPVD